MKTVMKKSLSVLALIVVGLGLAMACSDGPVIDPDATRHPHVLGQDALTSGVSGSNQTGVLPTGQ